MAEVYIGNINVDNDKLVEIGEVNLPILKGEKGDKGDSGEQGMPGPQGEPGTTDYNELENTPQNLSDFQNDVGFITEEQAEDFASKQYVDEKVADINFTEEVVISNDEPTNDDWKIWIDESENYTNDKTYLYTQSVASNEWIINHNLNKYPSVTVMDSANNEVIGEVEYVDLNNLKIKFIGSFSGKATLN